MEYIKSEKILKPCYYMKPIKFGSVQLMPIAQIGIILTIVLLFGFAFLKSILVANGIEIPQRYYVYVPVLIFSSIWPFMISKGIEENPEFKPENE